MVQYKSVQSLRQISLVAATTMTRKGMEACSRKSFGEVQGNRSFENRHETVVFKTNQSLVSMRDYLFGQLPLQIIQELVSCNKI